MNFVPVCEQLAVMSETELTEEKFASMFSLFFVSATRWSRFIDRIDPPLIQIYDKDYVISKNTQSM